jgi:hypothetical protein
VSQCIVLDMSEDDDGSVVSQIRICTELQVISLVHILILKSGCMLKDVHCDQDEEGGLGCND